MEYNIDLNKLSVDQLEFIVKLKKDGLLREVKKEVPIDKRKELLKELQGTKPSPSFWPVKQRKRRDYESLAKEGASLVRKSQERHSICEIYKKLTGKGTSSELMTKFRKNFENNLYGIRKIERGKKIYYISKNATERKWKRKNKITDKHRKYMAKRGAFILSRARALMRDDSLLDIGRAMSRASVEWRASSQSKKKVNNETPVGAPYLGHINFKHLQPEYKPIFAGMLTHVVNGKMLDYFVSSYSLAIESLAHWNEFLASVIANSSLIAARMEVPNRFRIVKKESHSALAYNGG